MKSKPAATNSSRIRNEAASSSVQPKTLPPRHSGAVWIVDSPSRRFSMTACVRALLPIDLDVLFAAAVGHGDHDADADSDRDADQGPRRADARQDAQFPQRGQQAADQDDKTNEVHACPLHNKLPPDALRTLKLQRTVGPRIPLGRAFCLPSHFELPRSRSSGSHPGSDKFAGKGLPGAVFDFGGDPQNLLSESQIGCNDGLSFGQEPREDSA